MQVKHAFGVEFKIDGDYRLLKDVASEDEAVAAELKKKIPGVDVENSVVFDFRRYWKKPKEGTTEMKTSFISAVEYVTFNEEGLVTQIDYLRTPSAEQDAEL